MQKNLVVSKVFSPSSGSLCKFRSNDKDYTTHCWISGLWCNFQSITFPMWFIILGCFFQWFILFCPLWDFDHTLLNARGSSQGPTPALWWCYDPAAVWNRWWGTTGRPKEDRPKELKRSRLAQNFSGFFFWLEEGIGGALKLPPQNST